MRFVLKWLSAAMVLLLPAIASAQVVSPFGTPQCSVFGPYPWSQNACIFGSDLNAAFNLSIGTAPPQNALGQGAQKGKLWLDTSVSPARLRLCQTAGGCNKTYTASDWIAVGAVDFNSGLYEAPIGGGATSLAAAAIVDLGSIPQALINITGSASITSFGTSQPAGQAKFVTFASGGNTLVKSASLVIPGGANISVSAGDVVIAVPTSAGVWQIISYTSANGTLPTLTVQPTSAALATNFNRYAGRSLSLLDFASGSGQTTTGAMSGSTALTLASALDFGQVSACLPSNIAQNLCGVLVYSQTGGGPGAATTVGTPASLTVNYLCTTITPTGTTVNGSKTISAIPAPFMAGLKRGQNITGSGVPGSTTITAVSFGNSTITISNAATASASGVSLSAVDPCNATNGYQYRVAAYDGVGGWSAAAASVGTGAGVGPVTLDSNDPVCVTWAQGSGTAPNGYGVWRSSDAGSTWKFIGLAASASAGSCAVEAAIFLDVGLPPPPQPFWVPSSPPTSAYADWLRTYVTAGEGTTSLTLAAAATGTISGALVMHDDTPGWTTWCGALNSTGADGTIPGTNPATGLAVVSYVNAPCTITAAGVKIRGGSGATIRPYGSWTGPYAVLVFGGASPVSLAPTLTANIDAGSTCLYLSSVSGLTLGEYLLVEAPAEAGYPWTLISPIRSIGCGGSASAVGLTDTPPIDLPSGYTTEAIGGTPTAGDTVAVTISDTDTAATLGVATITESSGYLAVGGCATEAQCVARDLALCIQGQTSLVPASACASTTGGLGIFSFSNGATTYVPTPTGRRLTFSQNATGGHTTITPGSAAATLSSLAMVEGQGASDLTFNGTDFAWQPYPAAGANFAVMLQASANGILDHIHTINMPNASVGGYWPYRPRFAHIVMENGSGGAVNLLSASDLQVAFSTGCVLEDIHSIGARSFGPQLDATSNCSITDMHVTGTMGGRGLKLGAAIGTDIKGLDCSGMTTVTCFGFTWGSRVARISNLRADGSNGASGNSEGIWGGDGFNDDLVCVNCRVINNSQYDIASWPSDTNWRFSDSTVTSLAAVFNQGGSIFSNLRYLH